MKYKSTLTVLLILVGSFSILAFSSLSENNSGWEEEEVIIAKDKDLWKDYKTWYRATENEPNTGDVTGFLDGKHRGNKGYREIYVNSVGEATHKKSGAPKYPEGTVIVKEQFKNERKWRKKRGAGLTIMVKLAPGTSPETGDWGYVIPTILGAKISKNTGKTAKFCGSCHVFGAGNDYTFMTSDFIKQVESAD